MTIKSTQKKKMISLLAVLLLLALLLPAFTACTVPDSGDESSDSSSETTPAETPVAPPAESGTLGEAEIEYPGDPEKEEAPANPAKTLFAKSGEKYNGSDRFGCKSVTILAKYNIGVEHNITAYKNTTEKVFYLCLPSRADLSCVTFMVTHYDGSTSGPYTADFSDDEVSDLEKAYGNTSIYTLKGMKSDRPSLHLIIDEKYGTIDAMNKSGDHSVYTYGDMVMTMPEATARANGWTTRYESVEGDETLACSVEIRGRGNGTWGKPKLAYQFELETDMDLLGLGSSDKFVLLANYNDATLMRNQIALWLGQELEVEFTSSMVQVDVFMNDKYLGMYMLAEKCEIAPNRIEIDKDEDYLYEVAQKYQKYGEYGFLSTNDSLGKIRLHNDNLSAEKLAEAKAIFYAADNAAYGKDEEKFLQYFDLESFAKAYIIQQFMMNHDAYWGSFYFYYDASDGKLHACSPWDFDYALGISWASKDSKYRVEDPSRFDISTNYLIEGMIKFDSFKRAVVEVYYNGGGEEIIKKIPEMIEYWTEENRLGAEMNAAGAPARWYPDSDYTNYTEKVKDYDSAVTYLEYIVNGRIEWFDSLMAGYLAEVGLDAGAMKGSGTATDPYIIAEPMDFANLMLNVQDGETFEGKYILQTADIELLSFTPFLGIRSTFAGAYNGNGHSIKYKVSSNEGCLFPRVTGTVMNLVVEGKVENLLFGAGIARSVADGGAIINCVVYTSLQSSSAGGVTVNTQSGSKLYGCVFLGEMDKDNTTKGAIAATPNKDTKAGYNFSLKAQRANDSTVTVESDIAKIAAALNANREAIASAAGVSAKDLCEARVESGRLVLVPVK